MEHLPFDARERLELARLFDEVGPSAPTLIDGWTAHDLVAHLVLRERDPVAAPCLVLPGPFQRFAARRQAKLSSRHDFAWLVARLRSGPPPGFFRIRWVRSFPSLNEFFVHHEDLRRANGLGPRALEHDLEAALWQNVGRGGRFLSRGLRGAGLVVEWAGRGERRTVRKGEPVALLTGAPGELLLYLFGRERAAEVDVSGPAGAVEAVRRAHFGM